MRAAREHGEAVALCQWWAYQANRLRLDQRLLIHIPNEGKRTPWGGKRLKDEGLRPGTPDYLLAVPRKPYSGLFIELKAPNGKLTSSQFEMLDVLRLVGYSTAICLGAEAAIRVVSHYLSLPSGDPSHA